MQTKRPHNKTGQPQIMDIRQLGREVVYTGKIFDLIVDQVEYPSGNRSVREIAHHPGGAVVVPVLDDGSVMMVKQLRYPLGKYLLELPAGKLNKQEDPLLAANRELEEETGWVAGEMVKLASFYTTPGFCDEELHVYLGKSLSRSPAGTRREEGELSMTIETVPFDQAVQMAVNGELKDGKTIIGLLLAERYMRKQ
ncbi:MAG: NUDIX hydrolase [bacterium]